MALRMGVAFPAEMEAGVRREEKTAGRRFPASVADEIAARLREQS